MRFYGSPNMRPEAGTYLALNHGRYIVPCFDVSRSSDVVLRDITVYHSLSHGVVASRTENLTLEAFNIVAREDKDASSAPWPTASTS